MKRFKFDEHACKRFLLILTLQSEMDTYTYTHTHTRTAAMLYLFCNKLREKIKIVLEQTFALCFYIKI